MAITYKSESTGGFKLFYPPVLSFSSEVQTVYIIEKSIRGFDGFDLLQGVGVRLQLFSDLQKQVFLHYPTEFANYKWDVFHVDVLENVSAQDSVKRAIRPRDISC